MASIKAAAQMCRKKLSKCTVKLIKERLLKLERLTLEMKKKLTRRLFATLHLDEKVSDSESESADELLNQVCLAPAQAIAKN